MIKWGFLIIFFAYVRSDQPTGGEANNIDHIILSAANISSNIILSNLSTEAAEPSARTSAPPDSTESSKRVDKLRTKPSRVERGDPGAFGVNSTGTGDHCAEDEIWCGEGSHRCIPHFWMCDNLADCASGLDEENCNTTFNCPANTFVCSNGNCVYASFRCNGLDDCGDATDELECPPSVRSTTSCPEAEKMYRCNKGACISLEAYCDGFKDCPLGDDEDQCSSKRAACPENKFACERDGNCIPIPWVCDGREDCPDKSDEEYCENGERIPHRSEFQAETYAPICRNDQFACHNGFCIDRSALCDGHWDCTDFSDEGGLCGSCPSMKCEYQCEANPIFPTCKCPRGTVLNSDGRTCRDLDECVEGSADCGHFCLNQDGTFQCSCAQGYQLASDSKKCLLEKNDVGRLFVSVQREVRVFPLSPSTEPREVYMPLFAEKHISDEIYGLDYDQRTETLLLAVGEAGGEKGSIHYNRKGQHSCLVSGFDGLSNLAVDWVTRNIYYTVSGTSNQPGVGLCTNDGRYCKMLITGDKIHRVRALALHPRRAMLYWSDWDSRLPRIESAEMDGANRRVLVQEKIVWPNGLSIDYVREDLYWADGDLKMIEKINLRAQIRQVVVSRGVHHANELLIFDDRIFWGDWLLEAIVSTRLDNVTARDVLHSLPGLPYGLAIDHPIYRDFSLANPCDSAGCSHICALSGSSDYGFNCFCPDHYDENGNGSCLPSTRPRAQKHPEMCQQEFERLCTVGDKPCLNGGSCVLEQVARCACRPGYAGDYCEVGLLTEWEAVTSYSKKSSAGWVMVLLIVGAMLLALGVAIAVYIRKSGIIEKRFPSNSTPLRTASTISFSRFRREQESREEMEKIVRKGTELTDVESTGHVGSFGNPLYDDVYEGADVHKTVLALRTNGPNGHTAYYTIPNSVYNTIPMDQDSGLDQSSGDGSVSA